MPGAAAERLACAVEYWHLASLLLDDLPCMDDGEARRGRPCLHRLHGEPTTILTALALINRAYALVGEVFMTRSVKVRREALALVEGIMGPNGILGGQAADLAFVAAPGGASGISRIALQKTGALLWLCLALPSLWAAPGATRRRMLRRLGLYWGLAYQAINDLGDVLSNPVQMGKSAGRDATLRRPNLALALGVPATRLRVARLLRQAKSTINRLVADDPRQAFLAQWHESLFVTLGAVLSAA
jgi:geranylgeranyl diphosphate synthase type II